MSGRTLVFTSRFFIPVLCFFLHQIARFLFREPALLGPGAQQRHHRHGWIREGNGTIAFPARPLACRGGR
jgi:hypothetical protein